VAGQLRDLLILVLLAAVVPTVATGDLADAPVTVAPERNRGLPAKVLAWCDCSLAARIEMPTLVRESRR
jgi:hypothetical protein